MLAEKESRVGLEEVPVKHGKTASSTKGTIPEEDITSRQRGRVEEFKIDPFIGDLFQYFIEQFNMQHRPIVHCLIRKYIVNSRKNPVKLFSQLLQCQYRSYFSSLIGFFYEFGIGTSIDNKMALELYVRAAKDSALTFRAHAIDSLTLLDSFRLHNHYIGQFCLSSMFYYGKHVKKDDVKSFLLLSILAKEGSVRAQVTLGECYYEGSGTEKNESKAFELIASSAKKGNLVGKFLLGYCYQRGIGTERDESMGFEWYLQAAEGGNINSMHRVGDCYFDGKGTIKNDQKALEFFLKSAEGGLDVAWTDVGYCHLNGVGTDEKIRDEKKAFEYYLRSAKNGNAFGQCRVGICYINGFGTKLDIERAIYWLDKAKDDNSDAKRLLSELANMMI